MFYQKTLSNNTGQKVSIYHYFESTWLLRITYDKSDLGHDR